jgi:hypothetical protein
MSALGKSVGAKRELSCRYQVPGLLVGDSQRHVNTYVSAVSTSGVGFSGRSGLNLFSCDEHAFTEIQAFPLSHAPADGKPDLAHLNGELA